MQIENFIYLTPVGQTVGNAIRWTNHYSLDNSIDFGSTYIRWTVINPLDSTIQPLNNLSQIMSPQAIIILFKFQKQLVELTGTLEEERLRARRLQNERDVQQASAMSHKEKERQIKCDLENEKKNGPSLSRSWKKKERKILL